ncbi:MAG: hypothetical protein MK120_07305 [Puniceicoccaceae bacterium]|nr:hypothetical protein [Puniceicoccaceae bacterium]
MKFLPLFILLLLSGSFLIAQPTVWDGYAYVSGSSTVSEPTWYDMGGSAQAQDLHNANLGSFQDTLWLGGQIKAWPGNNGGDNVANAGLSYNIYADSDTTYSNSLFNGLVSYNNQSFDGNDEQWGTDVNGSNTEESAVNLLNSHAMDAGTYRIVTYASATATWGGVAYDSNLSNNYVSTFTVVPESSSISLFFGFISILFVALRRK